MNAFKFSRYNIVFEALGKRYLYNTLSTAIAELDKETAVATESGNMSLVDESYIDTMNEQHFIVDSKSNEAEEYLYFYDRTRFGKSSKSLSINFIPSYNCNLACPYCIQGLHKENENVTVEKTENILKFIESTIANSLENDVPISKLYVHLYGGEPMMQKDTLIFFADSIYNIGNKYNCQIIYSMTSNLTLLDEDMLALIKKNNIHIQASIDGTKTQHDSRRIYKNGKGTYELIINNLRRLNENDLKDCITIRLNIDKDNLDNVDEIMQSVYMYSNDVYFGFLDTFKGYNDMFSKNCITDEVYPEVVSQKFNEVYKKYGFAIPQPFGKMSPCSLCCENKYFIDYHLDVYKCEMLLNQPVARAGQLSDDGIFIPSARFYSQMNHSPRLFEECMECKLLPLCAGGCVGKAYIASEKKDGVLNEKRCLFTEQALITYLKSYITGVL